MPPVRPWTAGYTRLPCPRAREHGARDHLWHGAWRIRDGWPDITCQWCGAAYRDIWVKNR